MEQKQQTSQERVEAVKQQMQQQRNIPRPAGYWSNSIITARNRGVVHQFADSIGGCSANYR